MRRTLPLLALVSALVLVGASCADQKDTGFPPVQPRTTGEPTHDESPSPDGPLDGPIDVADPAEFIPKIATVKVGTKVEWVQSGTIPHTVTAADESLFDSHPDCPPEMSKCMLKGDEFSFTFDKPGTYPYYCKLHGTGGGQGMYGEIIVEE